MTSGDGDRILKVNHAGEHGAVSIYTGQLMLARMRATSMVAELAEFHCCRVPKLLKLPRWNPSNSRPTLPALNS